MYIWVIGRASPGVLFDLDFTNREGHFLGAIYGGATAKQPFQYSTNPFILFTNLTGRMPIFGNHSVDGYGREWVLTLYSRAISGPVAARMGVILEF